MLQTRGDVNLPLEALRGDALGEFRIENLYDHLASELRVGGDEHARHPAAAELSLKIVASGKRLPQAVNQVGRQCGSILAHDQLYDLNQFPEISRA